MFDLIIILDGKSYYNRKELVSLLDLQRQPDINGDELYTRETNGKQHIIANVTKDLSEYFYEEEETLPYEIAGVCHFTFYPFLEPVNEILPAVIDFNSGLFVDDDNGNIINICEYKELVSKEKVYPFTYVPKEML